MAHTDSFVSLVSTVSGCRKNARGKGSPRSGNITKLEQSTFLQISIFRYISTSIGPTHRPHHPTCLTRPICLLVPPVSSAPTASTLLFVEEFLCQLLCLEQSIYFLRYLCQHSNLGVFRQVWLLDLSPQEYDHDKQGCFT